MDYNVYLTDNFLEKESKEELEYEKRLNALDWGSKEFLDSFFENFDSSMQKEIGKCISKDMKKEDVCKLGYTLLGLLEDYAEKYIESEND